MVSGAAAGVACRATAFAGSNELSLDREVVGVGRGDRLHEYFTRASAFGLWGTVLVAVDDVPLLHHGYGYADLERDRPNTVQTLFDVGSTTKTMTAGAILLLASEGKLAVSDTIDRFFANVPSDKRGIRLEHLLTHTSGIVDPPNDDYEPITRDALVGIVMARALGGVPGAAYNYSNSGFSLLAAIVEIVTGMPYETFMRKRFFGPAGMTTMGYRLPRWTARDVAHTYTYPVDHGSPLERLRRADGPGWILMGNGGLIGTAADLIRWERSFRSGRLIPHDAYVQATSPRFTRGPRSAIGYDWEIALDDDGAYGHGSDAPQLGLNGWIGHSPKRRESIAWLANNRMNGASSRRFLIPNIKRLLANEHVELPPAIDPPSAGALRSASGVFVGPDSTISVRAAERWLEVGANGQDAVDVFNARQGEDAVAEARLLDEKVRGFLQALHQDKVDLAAAFVQDEEGNEPFADEWRRLLAGNGVLRSATALGTFRLDRRGAYLSTVRLEFPNRSLVGRFEWQGEKMVTASSDLNQPKLAGPIRSSPVPFAAWQPFWYPRDDAVFTFDLLTGTTLAFAAMRKDGRIHELSSQRKDGSLSRWAARNA
jgi:CubicO group peptidase (beta-lactamase class C family)